MADIYQQLSGVAAPEQARVTDGGAPGGGGGSPYDLSSKTWDDMRVTHKQQSASSEALVCTADDAVGGRLDEAIKNGESLLPPVEIFEQKVTGADKGEAKITQKPVGSDGKISKGSDKE